MAANTHTSTPSTVYLSAETPDKHKQSSLLADAASSIIPAAMLAAMLPAISAGCLTQTVLACAFAASFVAACVFGAASCYAKDLRPIRYAAFVVSLASVLLILAVPGIREGLFSLYNGVGILGAALGLCAWLSQCRLTQLRGSSYPLSYVGTSIVFNVLICTLFFGGMALAYSPIPSITTFYTNFEKGH